jgi:hypothetical protein
VPRWLPPTVIAVVLTVFAVLLLTGQYVNEGPTLFRLAKDHGVHLGDLFVVTGWAASLAAEAWLLLGIREANEE